MKKTLSIPRPIVLTGEEIMDEASRVIRAEKEKKRGIIRDREGKIIRDKKWKKERVQFLKIKEKTIKQRLENAPEEKQLILKGRLEIIKKELKKLK